MNECFEPRLARVLAEMERQGIGCMLITPSPDLKYLSGCAVWPDERLMTLVLAPGHAPFMIANRLYEQTLSQQPYRDVCYWADRQDPFALLAEELQARKIDTDVLAVDDALAAGLLLPLLRRVPHGRVELASRVTAGLRLYKDAQEILTMRTACAKASEALRRTMEKGRYWIGHTETELADALCSEMVRQGLERGSASVSSGVNSAEPHHASTSQIIRDNSCLWIDFGAVYQNYNTDMTRAFFFGTPDEEYRRVYDVVDRARKAGIAAAQAGAPLHAVDDAARGVIEAAGYGACFTHRTGHGIGIMNHEGPAAEAGEQTLIAPGMTFSVEPGIYIPGRFGIRVEDQVLIGEDGKPQALHDYPTDLTVFD